jgi:AcrR family transcriptional regulator
MAAPQTRPGGRSARVRAQVIEATSELLLERGYGHVSLHAIAKRSGVHHTTLYRRWGSLSAIVLDAVSDLTAQHLAPPDLGTIQADLEHHFRAVTGSWDDPQIATLTRSLILSAPADTIPHRHAYWDYRASALGELLTRAVQRGQLPEGIDTWTVLETIAGPLWMRFLVTHLPIDDDVIAAAVRRGLDVATREALA